MSVLSPIEPSRHARASEAEQRQPRTGSRLLLDPLLTLAVIGLGVCSVITLSAVTAGAIPGDPHYYSERQGIYLFIGALLMLVLARVDYARLRHYKLWLYGALILSILAVLGAGHAPRARRARSASRSSPFRPPSSARSC